MLRRVADLARELLEAGRRMPPAAPLAVTVQRYLPLVRNQARGVDVSSLARVRSRTCGRSLSRASLTDPSNRIRPPATMAIRSQSRSACAMTWVEKRMVTPRRA